MTLLLLHLMGQKYNAVGARDTSMLLLTVRRTSAITISVMGMLFFSVFDNLHGRMNSHRNRIRLHFKHKCTRSLMRLPLLLEWSWCDSELSQWFYVLSPLPSHQWVSQVSNFTHPSLLNLFPLPVGLLILGPPIIWALFHTPYKILHLMQDMNRLWPPMDKLCPHVIGSLCQSTPQNQSLQWTNSAHQLFLGNVKGKQLFRNLLLKLNIGLCLPLPMRLFGFIIFYSTLESSLSDLSLSSLITLVPSKLPIIRCSMKGQIT